MRPEIGGPPQGVRRITEGYAELGHSAEIVSLDPEPPVIPGLRTPLHALGVPGVHNYGRSPRLRPWLRENAPRFDAFVVHGLWQYHGYAALKELAGKQRYAVFTHGMLDPWFNRTSRLKQIKKLPYWLAVERPLLRCAERVLFTSTTEANLALQSFPFSNWTPEVVPYGTPGPPDNGAAQLAAFHERVPSIAGRPFILYLSRIHPKKGCDILLEAYAEVSRETRLPLLVMAGPDAAGFQAKLQSLASTLGIADNVLWPGMIVGDAKWGAFRAAEAFILPSHQENFGIAVAEAASCGTPVLTSTEVNIHGEISASHAGFVAPDTRQGTAALLRQWAALDPAARQRMSANAMLCWQSHFNSAGTARAIVEVFTRPQS